MATSSICFPWFTSSYPLLGDFNLRHPLWGDVSAYTLSYFSHSRFLPKLSKRRTPDALLLLYFLLFLHRCLALLSLSYLGALSPLPYYALKYKFHAFPSPLDPHSLGGLFLSISDDLYLLPPFGNPIPAGHRVLYSQFLWIQFLKKRPSCLKEESMVLFGAKSNENLFL